MNSMTLTKEQKEHILNLSDYEILRQPFNINVHKLKFIHYLEIVIRQDGTIEYATPSHQEKMLNIIQEKTGMTREELWNSVTPYEYGIEWLCQQSGAIPVWENFYGGVANDKQLEALTFLKEEGVYLGPLWCQKTGKRRDGLYGLRRNLSERL